MPKNDKLAVKTTPVPKISVSLQRYLTTLLEDFEGLKVEEAFYSSTCCWIYKNSLWHINKLNVILVSVSSRGATVICYIKEYDVLAQHIANKFRDAGHHVSLELK